MVQHECNLLLDLSDVEENCQRHFQRLYIECMCVHNDFVILMDDVEKNVIHINYIHIHLIRVMYMPYHEL